MSSVDATTAWRSWCEESKRRADHRWKSVQGIERRKMKGEGWLTETRKRLIQLASMGILPVHEQARVKKIELSRLDAADQRRLKSTGYSRGLYAFGIAAGTASSGSSVTSRS